jgi:hypothetical protein
VTAVIEGTPGISSQEVTEWMAYERVEGPQDGTRGDFHAAQVVQAMIALWGTKKGAKPPSIDKLRIQWDGGAKPVGSGLQMLAKIAALNQAMKGTDERLSAMAKPRLEDRRDGD